MRLSVRNPDAGGSPSRVTTTGWVGSEEDWFDYCLEIGSVSSRELLLERAAFKSLSSVYADTTTPHGRLMVIMPGGLAEFKRELSSER
jgi:hypothetical protein